MSSIRIGQTGAANTDGASVSTAAAQQPQRSAAEQAALDQAGVTGASGFETATGTRAPR